MGQIVMTLLSLACSTFCVSYRYQTYLVGPCFQRDNVELLWSCCGLQRSTPRYPDAYMHCTPAQRASSLHRPCAVLTWVPTA